MASHFALIGGATVLSAIVLLVCGWLAWTLESWFRQLEPSDFRKVGRPPTTNQGLDKRIREATTFRWKQAGTAALKLSLLFIVAVGIPTFLLLEVTAHYRMLVPGHTGFSVAGRPESALSDDQLRSFIFGQFTRGTLLDTIEIFDMDIAAVDYQRTDLPITTVIFVYRLFVELFAAGFFLGALRFVLLFAAETPGLRNLKWRRSIGGRIGRS